MMDFRTSQWNVLFITVLSCIAMTTKSCFHEDVKASDRFSLWWRSSPCFWLFQVHMTVQRHIITYICVEIVKAEPTVVFQHCELGCTHGHAPHTNTLCGPGFGKHCLTLSVSLKQANLIDPLHPLNAAATSWQMASHLIKDLSWLHWQRSTLG